MSELPKGWVETTLGRVVDYGRTEKANSEHISDDTWVLELEDIEKNSSKLLNKVSFLERQPKSSKNAFKVGDVLYGKLRPYLNKIIIATDNGICTSEIIPLRVEKGLVDNHFLFYWLKGIEFSSYVTAVSYGVNMPRLGTKDGKQAPFILAPLAEQKRIVEKLDQVLAQVDTIKARLDGIPAILKRFRQSVLAAAVSGKLTEEWRGGESFTSQIKKLGNAGVSIKTGPFGSALHKHDYINSGVPVINPMHIFEGQLFPSESMTINESKYSELSAWHLLDGDVIVGRRGEMGRAATVKGDQRLLCGTGSMILRVSEDSLPKYLELILRSPTAIQYFNSASVGSTMVNLNQKVIKDLEVYFPPFDEQTEIVRLVDQYFAFADTIEQQVQKAQQRVDKLTQSILAKAFRGELVPQNPTDEPAEELLKRIAAARAESEALAKAAKKVGKKTGKS